MGPVRVTRKRTRARRTGAPRRGFYEEPRNTGGLCHCSSVKNHVHFGVGTRGVMSEAKNLMEHDRHPITGDSSAAPQNDHSIGKKWRVQYLGPNRPGNASFFISFPGFLGSSEINNTCSFPCIP